VDVRAKTFLLVVFGVAAGLAGAETGIRLLGTAYSLYRLGAAGRGERRILCVGDSFTFGNGAPRGESYPEQLERQLREGGANPGLRVINRGVPGMNSSQLAREIGPWLDRWRPAILLVLIGDNNADLTGSTFHLLAGEGVHGRAGALGVWDIRLQRFRVYKQLRLAMELLRQKRGDPPEPEPETGALLARARSLFERGKHQEAALAVQAAVRLQPGLGESHARLGEIRFEQRRFGEAARGFEEALDLDPGNKLAAGFIRAIPSFAHSEEVLPVAREAMRVDLLSIVKEARARDAVVVLQSYPHPNAFTDGIPDETAGKEKLLFADHAASFAELFAAGKAREFLSGDTPDFLGSHPNAAGYGLMARKAALVLRKSGSVE